jgi:hypothetical protein
MTDEIPPDRLPTVSEALEERDITLALTPGQIVLLAIGAFILMRILRGLRG